MLALDCHPWNGGLYLAILKRSEVVADPELADPAEMAAWELYDCGASLAEWAPVADLALQMRADYSSAAEPSTVADTYLRACAIALQQQSVARAIRTFELAEQFRCSVAHPDDGREYCHLPLVE